MAEYCARIRISEDVCTDIGPEIILMDKLSAMYETLIKECPNKIYVNAAIRFEIKRNCMQHPYDIFGSQLSKKIESIFQEILNSKDTPSSSSSWFCHRFLMKSVSWLKLQLDRLPSVTKREKLCLTIKIVFLYRKIYMQ